MSSLRAIALATIGGAIGTAAVAALVAGCGGDDNGGGMMEAGPDVTAEGGGGPDVAPDTKKGDTGGDQTTSDVVPEVSMNDADAGGGHDADADAGHDGDAAAVKDGDSGSEAGNAGDAGPDSDARVPTAAEQYVIRYTNAYCQGYLHCCPGYDAGGIDFARCAANVGGLSQESTLPNNPSVYPRGHLAVNEEAGAGCVAAIPTLPCTIAAADNSAVTDRCYGVFTGNIAIDGGGCLSSFECVTGFCSLPDGGGTGTCTPLIGTGGACLTDDQCTQAQLKPVAYCTSVDTGGVGVCAPLIVDGLPCGEDLACVDEWCALDNAMNPVCGGNPLANTGNCATYAVPDAGGD